MWQKKLSLIQNFRITGVTFSMRKTALFLIEKALHMTPFKKLCTFTYWIMKIILSHNKWRIRHITKSFILILAKIVKILHKLSGLRLPGVQSKKIFSNYNQTGQDVLPLFRPKCPIVVKVDSLFHQRKPLLCASSLGIAGVLSSGIKSLP